jgi:hypothetical protein
MYFVSALISDGLGNRFFQVAAMLGYAEKHGFKCVFVNEWMKDNNHIGPKTIFDYFPDIQTSNPDDNAIVIHQPFALIFTYLYIPRVDNNIKLQGFFQSEKYFPVGGVPRPFILGGLDSKYRDFAFLHVRRGDYLLDVCRHHNVDLTNYYQYALSYFSNNRIYILVCSDDIEWCRQVLPDRYRHLIRDDRWEFFDGSDYETLRAMTACGHGGICANSTFSWWGAYWGHLQSASRIYTMPYTWGYLPLPQPNDLHPTWATILPV